MSALKRHIEAIITDRSWSASYQSARIEELIQERERIAAEKAWDDLARIVYPLYEAAESVLLDGADKEALAEPLGKLGAQSNPYREDRAAEGC